MLFLNYWDRWLNTCVTVRKNWIWPIMYLRLLFVKQMKSLQSWIKIKITRSIIMMNILTRLLKAKYKMQNEEQSVWTRKKTEEHLETKYKMPHNSINYFQLTKIDCTTQNQTDNTMDWRKPWRIPERITMLEKQKSLLTDEKPWRINNHFNVTEY